MQLAGGGVKQTSGDRVCAWRQAAQCAGGTAEGAWLVLGLHMKLNCRQTALHGPSSTMICLWPCLYITALRRLASGGACSCCFSHLHCIALGLPCSVTFHSCA